MSEKRHKINKFANYQNIIVRNSPAFDCHVFLFSQDRWSMVFDVMRMITTQIRWQDPCWSLCKLWERRLDFNVWEVASNPPPPGPLDRSIHVQLDWKIVRILRTQVRASSQTESLERGWKQRARLGRDAKNTFFLLSPHTPVLRHALPISFLILRKKPTVLPSNVQFSTLIQ